jgi:glyoxylase-like metal-dependent hydrolase (beta-lactamase superfamily II)
MNRSALTRSRGWPVLALPFVLAVGLACASDDDAATPRSTEVDTVDEDAAMTADAVGDVTIHSFLGPSLNTGTYVIESSASVVVVDTGYRSGDPETFRAAVDALDKPIATVLITHDHPDHVGGLNTAFADAPVATTAAVADLIDAGDRDIEILEGPFMIDGIEYVADEYLDVEARAQMVVTLPDHDAIFTGDLVFNETHLFLTPHLDRWISILEELQLDSPSRVYPGHGPPDDPSVYAATIEYLLTARAELASASSGEEYTAAMIDAYPDWEEPSLIEFYPRALLSQPAPPTTER